MSLRQHSKHQPVDSILNQLTSYACGLNYARLTPEAIHAAKVRVIDTLGVLIGGFFAEPCRVARNLATEVPGPQGATIIGTRMKATADIAAFVNGTTARYLELTDASPQHRPGSIGGHPSDVMMPVFAAAEYGQVSGREFIMGIVLAYEVYMHFYDVFNNMGYDHTNFCCIATAVSSGRLLGLSPSQLSHCISMAVVPNSALRVGRLGHLSMWKVAATGQAGRSGVFAALLARAGMEGPDLPFEGTSGWCDHVALERFSLGAMGNGTSFKVFLTGIKMRPCVGGGIPCILAAEKIAPLQHIEDVREVVVEVWEQARKHIGIGAHHWHPDSKETADHSAAYLVATTLMDGTVTTRSYDDAHLWNPKLRVLIQKIKVIENREFTKAYERMPAQRRTRVTVVMENGQRFIGEAVDEKDDLSTPKSDAQVDEKFRGLTEDVFGAKRVYAILNRLWHLEDMPDVAALPADFVLS